jgi:hypothetical protein
MAKLDARTGKYQLDEYCHMAIYFIMRSLNRIPSQAAQILGKQLALETRDQRPIHRASPASASP